MHKGQGAILEKVSVVTKPKAKLGKRLNKKLFKNIGKHKLQNFFHIWSLKTDFRFLGHHNTGFSAGSSDNLSDTPSPGSSLHSRGVFPNKRKKSSIANFMDKALPNRKKKR